MLVKFVIRKFPKRLTSLKCQYVFSQILEAEGDCYHPPPQEIYKKYSEF